MPVGPVFRYQTERALKVTAVHYPLLIQAGGTVVHIVSAAYLRWGGRHGDTPRLTWARLCAGNQATSVCLVRDVPAGWRLCRLCERRADREAMLGPMPDAMPRA